MPDPVDAAAKYIGTPYKFGGSDCNGIDCSALIQNSFGGKLPRVAHEQYNATTRIPANQLLRGDLVFLHRTQHNPPVPDDWASHVGVYDGEGNVIHAGSKGVAKVPLAYFTQNKNFYGAGRVNPALKLMNTKFSSPLPNLSTGTSSMPTPKPRPAVQAPAPSPLETQISNLLANPRPIVNQWAQPPSADLASALHLNPAPQAPAQPLPGASDAFGTAPPAVGPVRDIGSILGFQSPPQPQQAAPSRLQLAAQYGTEIANKPGQHDDALLQAQRNQAQTQALLDFTKNNVPQSVEYTPYTLPAMPQREQPAIPDRPAPQQDTASTILAGLAGLIDPIGAGHYAASPIQAGIQVANQQYEDRKQHFTDAVMQENQQYTDRMAAFNAITNNDLRNREFQRETDLTNRGETIRRNEALGNLQSALAGDGILTGPNGYADLSQRDHAAAAATSNMGLVETDAQAADRLQQEQAAQQMRGLQMAEGLTRIQANRDIHAQALEEQKRKNDLTFDPNSPQNLAKAAQAQAATMRAAGYIENVDSLTGQRTWVHAGKPLPDGTSATPHYPAGYVPNQRGASSKAPADLLKAAENDVDVKYMRDSLSGLQAARNKAVATGKDPAAIDREMTIQNDKLQQARQRAYESNGLNWPAGTPQAASAVPAALPRTLPGQVPTAPPGASVPLPAGVGNTAHSRNSVIDRKRAAAAARKAAGNASPAPSANTPIIRGNGFTLTPKG